MSAVMSERWLRQEKPAENFDKIWLDWVIQLVGSLPIAARGPSLPARTDNGRSPPTHPTVRYGRRRTCIANGPEPSLSVHKTSVVALHSSDTKATNAVVSKLMPTGSSMCSSFGADVAAAGALAEACCTSIPAQTGAAPGSHGWCLGATARTSVMGAHPSLRAQTPTTPTLDWERRSKLSAPHLRRLRNRCGRAEGLSTRHSGKRRARHYASERIGTCNPPAWLAVAVSRSTDRSNRPGVVSAHDAAALSEAAALMQIQRSGACDAARHTTSTETCVGVSEMSRNSP